MLDIENPEEDRLTRALAEKTGETITQDLLSIGKRCAELPDHDLRSHEEILGFDEYGLPH